MSSPRIRYQTLEFDDFDLHVCTLRDRQEFSDDQGTAANVGISSAQWSHFGVLWPASVIMATKMASIDLADRRFLEAGCGIGLPSLILNRRGADITAMDYHPGTEEFLRRNTDLNGDPPISFTRASWVDLAPDLMRTDVIVGSDLLYEDEHAEQLSIFIDRHLNEQGDAYIADPGRGTRGRFARKMRNAGFVQDIETIDGVQILHFSR